jgi:hypothetical protein
MTALADLKTMPGRRLLVAAAETIRAEAERIRNTQDALVAAGLLPAWADGQDVRRALLLAAAGALEWTAVAGAEEPAAAKAQRRKPVTLHRDITNAGRSEIVAEILARKAAASPVVEATESETEGAAA